MQYSLHAFYDFVLSVLGNQEVQLRRAGQECKPGSDGASFVPLPQSCWWVSYL